MASITRQTGSPGVPQPAPAAQVEAATSSLTKFDKVDEGAKRAARTSIHTVWTCTPPSQPDMIRFVRRTQTQHHELRIVYGGIAAEKTFKVRTIFAIHYYKE